MDDCHLTLREIVEEVGTSRGSVQEYYLEVLGHLHDAGQRKRPDMWTRKNWQLHHDNAPAHSAYVIKGFLTKNNKALVQQPPYSPDLAPCNFWLFPKLKTMLKRKQFYSGKDIMEKTTAELRSIPEEEFKRCFQKWQRHWKKCVHLQGEYFEAD